MAYTRGRCTNLDYCATADARRDVECRIGDPFTCPECGKPLKAPPSASASGNTTRLILAGIAALALLGAGAFAGIKLFGTAPQRQAIAARTARTAPATPVAMPPPAAAVAAPAPAPPQAVPQAVPTPAQPAPARAGVLLRLEGSASLGATLGPKLAEAYLAHLGDVDVASRPGAAPGETISEGVRADHREAILIGSAGDEAAFAALGAGTADIGMAARRITQPELDRLKPLGDLTAPQSEHVIALQGVAVIASPQNRVASLTRDQLRAIFTGATTDWSAVGGAPAKIVLYAQGPRSDIRALFSNLALDGKPLAARAKLPGGSAEVAAAVEADPNGIGFVDPAQIGAARPLAIAETGAAPVAPTPSAISGEDYPLTSKLYLYSPAASRNPFAQRFLAFAASAEGQGVVAQLGLVPLNLRAEAPAAPQTPTERYKQLVANATRLSLDLHFQPNSVQLDIASMTSIDRVWNMMMSDHATPDHLLLLGFADNSGDPAANLALSQKRVEAAAAVFAGRGLTPGKVVAFGSDLPIADNATEAGREKNRRVEVYLRN